MTEFHEHILSQIDNLILVVDENLHIVFVNTGFGKFRKRRSADFKGMLLEDALPISREQWQTLSVELKNCNQESCTPSNQTPREDNTNHNAETRDPLNKDHSTPWPSSPPSVITLGNDIFTYQVFDVAIDNGTRQGHGLIFNDLTREKNFLDRMTLAENTASLKTLVAGISHEIGNPLHSILSFADAMTREEDPKKLQHYASRVTENSQRIGKKFSEISGYVQSKGNGVQELVEMKETLESALRFALLPFEDEAIQVQWDFDDFPKVKGDPEELQQIWINILNNAVQAMQGKGKLIISGNQNEEIVTVTVQDSGPGMTPETLRKVFNPFFTTKMQGEGTGLGLSITQRLVEKYGGKIDLQSTVGQGTTVQISLPLGS